MPTFELDNLPPGFREAEGFAFEEATGRLFTIAGTDTGYTFEDVRSTIWGLGWAGFFYRLNPIGFATMFTAKAIEGWCLMIAPPSLSLVVYEDKSAMGGFVRRNAPERLIRVTAGENHEDFSAGRLASSIIRNGLTLAGRSWIAELKQAGFSAGRSMDLAPESAVLARTRVQRRPR